MAPDKRHEENARAWDVIAQAKYAAETEDHLQVPGENAGFPAEAVERELGAQRPTMLERQWRPDEVITSLLSAGLRLESFQEHPLLYWNQFPEWANDLVARLPHSYSVLAVRDE